MYSGLMVSNFRNRFNELFSERKTTNTELGNELNVSNQTISAWRLGTRSPKMPTVTAIASYFGVSVSWLLGFDVKKEDENALHRNIPIVIPDSQRFVKLTHYMSQEEWITVMTIFDKAEKRMKEEEDGQIHP